MRTRLSAGLLAPSGIAVIGLNVHSFFSGQRSALALGLLFGPAIVLVAGGALIQPPLLYTFGARRPFLTPGERRSGTLIGMVGLVIGVASTAAWLIVT